MKQPDVVSFQSGNEVLVTDRYFVQLIVDTDGPAIHQSTGHHCNQWGVFQQYHVPHSRDSGFRSHMFKLLCSLEVPFSMAGVDLITACDIRLCTQDAWFQVKVSL